MRVIAIKNESYFSGYELLVDDEENLYILYFFVNEDDEKEYGKLIPIDISNFDLSEYMKVDY